MHGTHWILGVHITDRIGHVSEVQTVLSKYGCNVKTRLGLHEVDEGFCSKNGLIILELFGEEKLCGELRDNLAAIKGVDVKEMVFEHPE